MYEHLIQKGIAQSLSTVPFHHEAPFTRYVMLEKNKVEGDGGLKVVTHVIAESPKEVRPYCDLHQHEFDEINLIISIDENLKYKIMLEDENYEVQAPATVYIPKGLRHAAEVISGKGIFVAILCTSDYKASK